MSEFNSVDFENSISFLSQRIEDDLYNNIKFQSDVMDSDAFNSTMEYFESKLNNIYEKFRTLEGVLAYAEEFTSQKIINTTKQCQAILNVIEDERSGIKNSAYISYPVSFIESYGPRIDRDNTALPFCSVINGVLTLSGQVVTTVPYSSINKTNSLVAYKSNLNELKAGRVYRTFYVVDNPITDGIMEEIQVVFDSPTVINCIDITPSKCKVSNVTYVYENGTEETEESLVTGITKYRKVKSIKFMLTSDKYTDINYPVDASRMKSNFWDVIKEAAYQSAQGNLTVVDIEELSGMQQHAKDYEKYVKDLAKWNADKEKSEKDKIKYQQDYNSYLAAKAEYDANNIKYNKDYEEWLKKYSKQIPAPTTTIRHTKVWGNHLDLPNARKWFGKYLSNYYTFEYVSTVGYTKAQQKAAVISKNDIIVGGTMAGVGPLFTVPSGTLRLWGQQVWDTDVEIEKWARQEKARLDAEAVAAQEKYKKDALAWAAEAIKNKPKPPTAPAIPTPPAAFNAPQPAFSDDLQIVHKYSYYFGLDNINVSCKNINENVCFISEDIAIGQMQPGEYIQLDAAMSESETSSVEFYILDGGRSVPILPISYDKVSNEKIFYNMRSRFSMDPDKAIDIKKNGMTTNITFEQAVKSNDGPYTVSYSPVNAYNYTPISSNIKLKAVVRTYDKTAAAPYIKKVQIKKYGGNALWKEDILVK